MHTGLVRFALSAAAAAVGTRPPDLRVRPRPAQAPYTEWWTDFYWHKVMFRQSYNQWGLEHVYNVLMRFTNGQLEFTTFKDLRHLAEIHWNATDYEELFRRTMLVEMQTIKDYFPYDDARQQIWDAIGFKRGEVSYLLSLATGVAIEPRSFLDTKRALAHWPSQNPFSRLWELRQMQLLLLAVLGLIRDLRADLTLELAPRIGWDTLRSFAPDYTPQALADHREEYGEPGDLRREPRQIYPPMPREPKPGDGPRPYPHDLIVKFNLDFWSGPTSPATLPRRYSPLVV